MESALDKDSGGGLSSLRHIGCKPMIFSVTSFANLRQQEKKEYLSSLNLFIKMALELVDILPIPKAFGSVYATKPDWRQIKYIDGLKKINALIGANNSGKSRLMREVIKARFSDYLISEGLSNKYIGRLKQCLDLLNVPIKTYKVVAFRGPFSEVRSSELFEALDFSYGRLLSDFVSKARWVISIIREHNSHTNENGVTTDTKLPFGNLDHTLSELIEEVENLEDLTKVPIIYVPSIRTLRVFKPKLLGKKVYSEYFGLNIDENKDLSEIKDLYPIVETGEQLFEEIINLVTSSSEGRRSLLEFENYLSLHFFNGEQVSIIANLKNEVIRLQIGSNPKNERAIHELGEGLQQMILLSFIAFSQKKGIVFIEEPEMYLHPGMQKQIMHLFALDAFNNFKFFVSTHSNHILDYCINSSNCSVFRLSSALREAVEVITLDSCFYGDREALRILGVVNSSVFLSNCTIWVEGITDRLYISKYISEFIKGTNEPQYNSLNLKIVEGIHYSFIFSGGNNIIHYDYNEDVKIDEISESIAVKYLTGRSMVISDNDNDAHRSRNELLKNLLNYNFLELPVIEIENLLLLIK